VLFPTTETAFVQTKHKLLDECDLWCNVGPPGGIFNATAMGVKTNLLFFTKGAKTGADLVLRPLRPEGRQDDALHDRQTFRVLRAPADARRQRQELVRPARRPHREELRPQGGKPKPQGRGGHGDAGGLLDLIEAKGREVAEAIGELRQLARE
jgi:type I restriction enzyme M protein